MKQESDLRVKIFSSGGVFKKWGRARMFPENVKALLKCPLRYLV
jgi:hypothetical protein